MKDGERSKPQQGIILVRYVVISGKFTNIYRIKSKQIYKETIDRKFVHLHHNEGVNLIRKLY
jgi:hypothetical protein